MICHFAKVTLATGVVYTVLLTALIETIVCILRFVLQLRSARDTAWMAGLTLGFRIHHGYIGLLIIIACLVAPVSAWLRNALGIVGVATLLSDVIHHFVVLWTVTGSPEFDLRYKCYQAQCAKKRPKDSRIS